MTTGSWPVSGTTLMLLRSLDKLDTFLTLRIKLPSIRLLEATIGLQK